MYKSELQTTGFISISNKCMVNKQKDVTMVYRSDKEDWVDIQKIQCETAKCLNSKHKWMLTTKGVCEHCGGKYLPEDEKFIHECSVCKKEVEPGDLTGLFIPHLCKCCEQKKASEQIEKKQVCLLCHQPYIRCCC